MVVRTAVMVMSDMGRVFLPFGSDAAEIAARRQPHRTRVVLCGTHAAVLLRGQIRHEPGVPMPKTQIISPKLRQPSGHFSHATMVAARGRLVFISGMTARRADGTIAGVGDIEAQTRQVCDNVKAAVEQAGGTMDDICRVDVYVRNMEHFDLIHKVRRDYFKAPAPASTMVEVAKMTSPDYLIEMSAIAVIGE
jgi:enamine deaminase RidA (YjgF/YER057c/UK114 family)